MRLSKIEFTNFRCFRSEVIEFSDYTSLVGPNNCGKSTALRALNYLYADGGKFGLTADDFSVGAAEEPMSILYEFDGVEGQAAIDFGHYVRGGKVVFELVATREVDGRVAGKCRGVRYGLPECAPFFAADKASERKPIYEALRTAGAPLDPWKNMDQAEACVRQYEATLPERHERIPSEENAYGATGPVPKLRRYLDWIYVPAVKDASAEAAELRNSAFSKLILLAVRAQYDFSEKLASLQASTESSLQEILKGADGVLSQVGQKIDSEFRALSTAPVRIALEWDNSQTVQLNEPHIRSIFRDGEVIGSPDMFGHGLQRTYIMALLNVAARAQAAAADNDFSILLGVEEPELYQHPPQARFLAIALHELANAGSQVIVTTHSPYFISGRTFASVRVLRKRRNSTNVYSWSIEEQGRYCAERKGVDAIGVKATLSGIDRSLQTNISEMFFATKLVLVEGAEDEAIITSYLRSKGRYEKFVGAGGHIIPVGGKTKMPMILALCRGFSIDVFCVFDFDMSQSIKDRKNEEIARYALDEQVLIPEEIALDFCEGNFLAWKDNIQGSITDDISGWRSYLEAVADEWGWDLSRMNKDPMLLSEAISRALMDCSDLPSQRRLADALEGFCERQ